MKAARFHNCCSLEKEAIAARETSSRLHGLLLRGERFHVSMIGMNEADKPMTVQEAGKRGGEKIKAKYGHEHFAEIGRKGGLAVKASRGPEHYAKIGRKGGSRVRKLISSGKAATEADASA